MLVPIGTIIAIEEKGCSCDARPALIGPDDASTPIYYICAYILS